MKKMTFNQLLGLMATVGLMVISSATQVLAFNPVSIGNTELNAYGFLRNNYGYFLEDQDYANNDDSKLATNRTWLRLNVDYRMSDSFSLFAVGQLAYEPEYDIEEGYDEFGKPKMSVSCKKRRTPVHIVKKPGGSILYYIKVEREEVPQSLSGGYTRIETAMDAVIRYLDKTPMTQSIKSELLAEEREKRKKAKAAS